MTIRPATARSLIAPLALALLASCTPASRDTAASRDSTPDDTTLVAIRGPTLVAVIPFPPAYLDSVTSAADAGTSDLAGAIDDFAYHLGSADSALAARGITVTWRFGSTVSFLTAAGPETLVLDPDSGVAYLFLTPTTRHVHRGVLTNIDLVLLADSAFARARRP